MKNPTTLKDLLRTDHDEPAFDHSHLSGVLEQHEMPPLDHSSEGHRNASRARVIRALAKKFGPTFKNYPHVAKALQGYDGEVHFHKVYQNMMRLRHG